MFVEPIFDVTDWFDVLVHIVGTSCRYQLTTTTNSCRSHSLYARKVIPISAWLIMIFSVTLNGVIVQLHLLDSLSLTAKSSHVGLV